MQLKIDSRERGLISIFRGAGVPHQVQTLPLGDVLCQYESGHVWIAERKRADDFAASLQDGRWREQSGRLFASGHQVVFIFEGDLRETGEMYQKLIGAWLNCELRRCYVFRTLRHARDRLGTPTSGRKIGACVGARRNGRFGAPVPLKAEETRKHANGVAAHPHVRPKHL